MLIKYSYQWINGRSLDSTIKVFDYTSTNWQVQFGWKFGSGVLSCGVSPINQKHFVAGLTSGLISIRTKTEPKVKQGIKMMYLVVMLE